MKFDADEVKILRAIVKKNLDELKKVEKLDHELLVEFASVYDYEKKLKSILGKLG